jgi:hypothetical protein
MRMMTRMRMLHNNESVSMFAFRWSTPDGNATIFVTETNPISVSITIGKAGTSVAGWAYALAELVNLALKNSSIDEVIDILTNITTHQSAFNSNGMQCRSTPEAVSFALIEYRRIKAKEKAHASR